MKLMNNNLIFSVFFFLVLLTTFSCNKSFLDRPPLSSITDANFYKTDEQVLAATALLYSEVWFDYNDKASYLLGDYRSGTTVKQYSDAEAVRFNITGDYAPLGASWRAFFNVVAQANLALYNIDRFAGSDVSESVKKTAVAEARVMRALAYRYLVMNWGPVPIIENNFDHLFDTSITRNTVPSVWRFITRELREAADDLPDEIWQQGRLTSYAAKGMLAKAYLARAGVEGSGGTRNQIFLDSAKYFAQDVIENGPYKLMNKYGDLFSYPYDNNSESLFELQWVYTEAWGTSNSAPEYLAYSTDVGFGGWGGSLGASWWMISQYEGFVPQADGTLKGRTLDERLHATYMLPGFEYPEITNATTKEKPLIYDPGGDNNEPNFIAIKKYVVGSPIDLAGKASQQHYDHDTYMLRLADIYLVYVEAEIGNNGSTTDAKALEYFNAVHTRAGLPQYRVSGTNSDGPLTFDYLFSERIKEFAMESSAWYDLVRLYYSEPQKAYSILNSQDRGFFNASADQIPNASEWTFTKIEGWGDDFRFVNANSGNFILPIPNAELSQAPNLLKEPVEYP